MTSLHVRAFLVSSLLVALAGCSSPATPTGTDAGSDAASGALDSSAEADAFSAVDTGTVADTGSATDTGPTSDAGSEYAGSYYRPSCGPADGPAFQLDLFQASVAACTVDDTLRTLGFYVHDLGGASLPPSAGSVITSTPSAASGTANRCPGGTPPCESSETWTLTFDTFVMGTGASGSYSVTWEDGSTSTGQFDAGWCGDRPVCG
jgi:hypothetical protein